jgi:hypothetical protein
LNNAPEWLGDVVVCAISKTHHNIFLLSLPKAQSSDRDYLMLATQSTHTGTRCTLRYVLIFTEIFFKKAAYNVQAIKLYAGKLAFILSAC